MFPVYFFPLSSLHWVPSFEQTESTVFTISSRSALGSFPFSSVIVSSLPPLGALETFTIASYPPLLFPVRSISLSSRLSILPPLSSVVAMAVL